eukprot:UN08736
MQKYFNDYLTDDLLEGLFIAFNSNVNECFNGLLCSISDKKTHVSYKDYVSYINTATSLYNVGEQQMISDRFDLINMDINDR